ncbi:hypothetical protein Q6348_04170 [Isoptericola sp. b441]|uniref:Restriction endonuclease n=1 Tax=Actinotalea lenta TaxID=3064654 RepID=A0ABT9D777_9CELL|nr:MULTISPECIES: hypothetical protein [unclassified Isoptericola]MDO8106390.1 hypothetical protein [Isoptericola sp. b441]MDO8121891.1 hypothetical protein [Isoptericola sp. b490]
MDVRHARFVRSGLDAAGVAELELVDALAEELADHLVSQAARIDVVHVHRAQSSAVQSIVADLLREQLGFRDEVVLTPQDGFVTHARPDFVYSLGPGRGIIAEVERGGTTTNNHDLKDLWKTHIASDAQHLFLIVPNANWNEAGVAREHPYTRVLTRLGSFFGDPRREIDVVSLHVFGYGREA